jgi:hypothetical protein
MNSKKFLLIIPENEHEVLKQYQREKAAADHESTILNTLIRELITTGIEKYKRVPDRRLATQSDHSH